MIDYRTQLKNTMSRIVNEYDKKILMKYIRWMQDKAYSEKTIAEKIRVNSKMISFFEKPVEDVTIDDMEDYIYSDDFCIHYRTGKPMAKSSIDTYKAEIRYFMRMKSRNCNSGSSTYFFLYSVLHLICCFFRERECKYLFGRKTTFY